MQNGCEGRVGVLNPQVKVLTAEEETVIAHQCPGQQPCLTEDLKAVADTQDEHAGIGRATDGSHDRGKAGNRAASEVITVGESSGQNDGIVSGKGGLLVPYDLCCDTRKGGQCGLTIRVAIRAGELNDGDLHDGGHRQDRISSL